MARLWLGWWPLPADEDMALGAGSLALSSGRASGRAAAAGRRQLGARAAPAPLAVGRADWDGRAPLAPRSLPLAPSSRSAPAAALSAAAAAAARSSGLRPQPQQQQQRQQRRRRRPEAGEGGSQREFGSWSTGSDVTWADRGGEGWGRGRGGVSLPRAGCPLQGEVRSVGERRQARKNFGVFICKCQSTLQHYTTDFCFPVI